MKYYLIAKNWKHASFDEIISFKYFFSNSYTDFNISMDEIYCVQEFPMSNLVDIYVKISNITYHFVINMKDEFREATIKDEIYTSSSSDTE